MKIKRITGIGACVETGKMDEAVAFFRDIFGAKVVAEEPFWEKFGFRAQGTWLGSDIPFRLEMEECIDDTNPVGRQIKRVAPGYQFLGVQVEDIDEAIAELRSKGIQVSDKLKMEVPGFESAYECMIHPKNTFGLIVELVEFKGQTLPDGDW